MTPVPPRSTPPPTRYRVIERGRRLEVVDTWAGERPSTAARSPGRLPGGVERTRFDGGGRLTTHRLYDARAPRTIALDSAAAAAIGRTKLVAIVGILACVVLAVWQPVVLILLFALGHKGLRDRARDRITRWLDGIEREAS